MASHQRTETLSQSLSHPRSVTSGGSPFLHLVGPFPEKMTEQIWWAWKMNNEDPYNNIDLNLISYLSCFDVMFIYIPFDIFDALSPPKRETLRPERQRHYAHQYHSSILNDIRIGDLMIRMSEFIQLGYVKCSCIPDLLDMDIHMFKCQYVYLF